MKGGEAPATVVVVGEEHCEMEDRELPVRKTMLFSPGGGLEAYDHRTGALAFHLETYGRGGTCGRGAAAGDLALLGAAGDPVLMVRRHWSGLHHRWDGFLVDGGAADTKPLFSARCSSMARSFKVIAFVPGRSANGLHLKGPAVLVCVYISIVLYSNRVSVKNMQVKDKSNYNFEKPFLYVPCREASWHKTEPAVRLLPDDAIGIQYIEFWDMGWSSCDHQHCVRKGSLDLNVETSLHWCTSWKRRTQGDLPWAPSEARHLGASPQLLGGG